jgi:hypothetical protein
MQGQIATVPEHKPSRKALLDAVADAIIDAEDAGIEFFTQHSAAQEHEMILRAKFHVRGFSHNVHRFKHK